MSPTQRREPERLVRLGVLVGADADQGALQQPNHCRHHLLARKPGQRDVVLDPLTNQLQHVAEGNHPLELDAVPLLAKRGMVAVLLPAACVARRHLQVTVRVRADPHVRPGGRDHQRPEAAQHGGVANRATLGIHVRVAAAVTPATNAGHLVRHVVQARRPGGGDVLVLYRLLDGLFHGCPSRAPSTGRRAFVLAHGRRDAPGRNHGPRMDAESDTAPHASYSSADASGRPHADCTLPRRLHSGTR